MCFIVFHLFHGTPFFDSIKIQLKKIRLVIHHLHIHNKNSLSDFLTKISVLQTFHCFGKRSNFTPDYKTNAGAKTGTGKSLVIYYKITLKIFFYE
jgi:hypothetical protein